MRGLGISDDLVDDLVVATRCKQCHVTPGIQGMLCQPTCIRALHTCPPPHPGQFRSGRVRHIRHASARSQFLRAYHFTPLPSASRTCDSTAKSHSASAYDVRTDGSSRLTTYCRKRRVRRTLGIFIHVTFASSLRVARFREPACHTLSLDGPEAATNDFFHLVVQTRSAPSCRHAVCCFQCLDKSPQMHVVAAMHVAALLVLGVAVLAGVLWWRACGCAYSSADGGSMDVCGGGLVAQKGGL